MSDDSEYAASSIRDHYILGQFIGKKVIDITESDPGETEMFFMLMFEDGSAIKFNNTTTFDLINVEAPDGYE